MIRKSMPSGHDPMGGYRFSEKIMLKQKDRAGLRFEEKSSRSSRDANSSSCEVRSPYRSAGIPEHKSRCSPAPRWDRDYSGARHLVPIRNADRSAGVVAAAGAAPTPRWPSAVTPASSGFPTAPFGPWFRPGLQPRAAQRYPQKTAILPQSRSASLRPPKAVANRTVSDCRASVNCMRGAIFKPVGSDAEHALESRNVD